MAKPPKKTRTEPGLGATSALRIDSAEMRRVRESFREDPAPESARGRIRDSVRREDPDEPMPSRPERRATATWEKEPTTGTRRKSGSAATAGSAGSGRPPLSVDDVGTAAVKLAARAPRRESAPQLLATRGMIAKAPIDTRTAFVLSLVDGRNSVDAIVDMAGMPAEEVKAILARLARLGLVSLP